MSVGLSNDGFVSMLRSTESYPSRRFVHDVAMNSLNRFFSPVIAQLSAGRDGGNNVREAYCV